MKFNRSIHWLLASAGVVAMLAAAVPAHALPILQMYIEGATYDQDTESWVTDQSNLTLWVIGDVGSAGSIVDVQLAAAYLTGETGSISITPTTATGLTDPSMSQTPVLNTSVGADGTTPIMSSGDPLPAHGIYGPGVSFHQWALGDMTLTDSQIGDFSGGFPTSFSSTGQVNAYNISISGYSMVHFDTFNHIESPTHVLFGPFSHDAVSAVPEPSSWLLLGLGFGVVILGIRRKHA